ncbi:hypothetical protein KC367_g3472 [Hortaea werneckii]|nr:hypothetical protein KC342_g2306 [Hortaea werneckii]KAI6845609.1 hypothetical protein KC350_g4352 [Hortaea werneckii]KAI6846195.1 hypothetical protein KC358_g2961 [Hortaea werneckii]KAI6940264.1 hypothetical protein KC341_g3631 [Hortaea werneckii]KAI6946327.1 hypothetical protein KC348_g3207 [Hortaea werneckii]
MREARQSLEAMKHLPAFLGQMGKRNALARQLEVTASTLLSHAQSVIYPPASHHEDSIMPASAPVVTPSPNGYQTLARTSNQDIEGFDHSHGIDASAVPFSEDFLTWPDDLFGGDATFDWFAWEKDFLA